MNGKIVISKIIQASHTRRGYLPLTLQSKKKKNQINFVDIV